MLSFSEKFGLLPRTSASRYFWWLAFVDQPQTTSFLNRNKNRFGSFLKEKPKNLFGCKMRNLATEKTKRNRLLSVVMLVKIKFCNRFNFSILL